MKKIDVKRITSAKQLLTRAEFLQKIFGISRMYQRSNYEKEEAVAQQEFDLKKQLKLRK